MASSGEEDIELDPETLRRESVAKLSAPDAILEPTVFSQLQRFVQFGGAPEQVVQLLSESFVGNTQAANLMLEWLLLAGVSAEEIQTLAEEHLHDVLKKHFDARKADLIFSEGTTPQWLEDMISHPTWRSLIFDLLEDHPDCLMLKFTTDLINRAGYHNEHLNPAAASQQVDAFSKKLCSSVTKALRSVSETDEFDSQLAELTRFACHGQHTFLYTSALLQGASYLPRGGYKLRRLSQELRRCALAGHHDVLSVGLALSGREAAHQRAVLALRGMLSREALNPADITLLFKRYSSSSPPPVEMLRQPRFLELLVTALTKPGQQLNPEHAPKYIYLLAYAGSVYEEKKGRHLNTVTSDLKETQEALTAVRDILRRADTSSSELLAELPTIFHHLRLAVVAIIVLRWCSFTLSEESYFSIVTDTLPLPFTLLDEIVTCHPGQQEEVFKLYTHLLEASYGTLDTLVQLELKKTIMDRLVHMISQGYVLPILTFIGRCTDDPSVDRSIIRHFITELLEMVEPPYSNDFMQHLLPVVQNDDVTKPLRNAEGSDAASVFVAYCLSELG